ncbi:MAG: hypothetical protein H7Z75_16620 [Ferruginibacter sp.]|nr:hypothetical protein [Cytophagales bacterium]
MKETHIQSEGKGLIDIKGNTDSGIFFHNKQPRVVAWEMDWNTLMNFFVGDVPDKQSFYLEKYFELSDLLKQGNLEEKGLVEILKPFMKMLSNATYELEVIEYDYTHFMLIACKKQDVSYVDDKELRLDYKSHSFYSGSDPYPLYGTQQYLNKDRVYFYENLIKQGKSPLPIILKIKDGSVNFIIDGHHKTQAYLRQGKRISAIEISKVNNWEIETEKFEQIIRSFSEDKELLESFKYLNENR